MDHCLLRVVPSLLGKSFPFIPGARERPWNQFRDSKEAWEPIPGLVEVWELVQGLKRDLVPRDQEAWKYFFNPLPVLERHTSSHGMTLSNKSKSNPQTTTWNSFFNSITFVSHKRSMLIKVRGNSQPLAIGDSSVVEEKPFEEVHRYSPQPTTPFPGCQQLDLMQILSGCCELQKHSIHSLISTNELCDMWFYTRKHHKEWVRHYCTMTSFPAKSF